MRAFPFLFFVFFVPTAAASQNNLHTPTSRQFPVLTCNNWLYLPSYQSYVNVGDLDIPGNQITVEAVFNRIAPYSNGYNWAGDLVSKHVDPTDANYLLRPNNAEITTTNGFFITPPICEIQLNKTYHAAFVYDGSTLKFYRNGFLMSSVPATGNLIQNNHNTRIGLYDANVWNTQLIGYINEVRIWNVAKTQSQIQANMNNPLPSPTTQPGLLAYYTFDDLLNKQGNPTWNGTLGGGASINQTNPSCAFFTDNCATAQNIGGIINIYTPVLGFDPCENEIMVEDAAGFNIGDTVLMIQMKGAVIDSSNSSNFGTVTDFKNAGNYEFNFVKNKTGNLIELTNRITRAYDLPDGKVQLVRIPYFQNARISSTLSCLPWDGMKGGILAFNTADSIILNADIDVSGKGFRGGNDPYSNPPSYFCYENEFSYPNNQDLASEKGEGIALISTAKSFGKGALANGGGGGNSHNSGGGGGSNGNVGGFGGYNFEGAPCNTNVPFDNRGVGGKSLSYNNTVNKIFLGGGGGAGHSNNPEAFEAKGGNGGGIIIINGQKLQSNGRKIISNGNNAAVCGSTNSSCHEGMGGGGGGGTVLLNISSYLGNSSVEVKGGNGGDMTASGFQKVGPGGGGGGGVIWLSNSSTPSGMTSNINAGQNGVATAYSNDPWGATPGQNGISLFNLKIPIDTVLFRPNIDSVRIDDSLLTCADYDFKGLAFTNTVPIASWQWYFGDGNTANTQNTSHSYSPGNYTVKLVVTDVNGCKDSISTNVTASTLTVEAGTDTTICSGQSVQLSGSSAGGTQFQWIPAAYLNNSTILNPVATPPPGNTKFILTATNGSGCSVKDSLYVFVRAANAFTIGPPASICPGDSVMLTATGGDIYQWTPGNMNVANPYVSPSFSTTYSVQITDTLCGNSTTLSTDVTVHALPNVRAIKSNDIDCFNATAQLTASGASFYSWSPATGLNNPDIANPLASPAIQTLYVVRGTDPNGCINYDSVTVNITTDNKGLYLMPTGFTPNNDGKNDCYGVKSWGTILDLEFSIYNRWGQRIFFTKNPQDCWNGIYQGVPQNSAVFLYVVKAKTSCEASILRKGTFVLIR